MADLDPGKADLDPLSFRAAYGRLRGSQKSNSGAPAYSRFVNRPVGRVFAALAYGRGLTPDQVTYLSAACSGLGIVALAVLPPSWPLAALVTIALVLGYALDSADGQLARLRGGGSVVGEWLDHMMDSAKITSLHLAVLVSAARFFQLPNRAWLLVPVLFTVVSAVHFFGMILVEQLVRNHLVQHRGQPPPSRTAGRPLLSVLKVPIDYGFLCVAFLLLGAPWLFFALYTLLALGWTCYLALALRKWHSDVSGLAVAAAGSVRTGSATLTG